LISNEKKKKAALQDFHFSVKDIQMNESQNITETKTGKHFNRAVMFVCGSAPSACTEDSLLDYSKPVL